MQVMSAYGYSIEQTLIIDIIPDTAVRKAMNEINAGIYHHLILLEKTLMNTPGFFIISPKWHKFSMVSPNAISQPSNERKSDEVAN